MITALVAYIVAPRISPQPDEWEYLIAVVVDLGILYALGSGIRDVLIAFATKERPK